MRKIIVLSMMSIDGVIQAPGRPEEDPSNNFEYGGWVAPYGDALYGEVVEQHMQAADLLLGRKTFEIFENYWPERAQNWKGINEVTKYVLSKTRNNSTWQNCAFLQNVDDIKKLKASEGSEIKVWGSSELVQILLKNDLVDELWLNIHPLILGKGKNIFDGNAAPNAFTLTQSTITTSGVLLVHYKKEGEIKTGIVGE